MWFFRPRLCLGFGKPAPDGIVPLLDKPLLCVSDKAAALRLRDGVQLSDGTLHNIPCLPVTDKIKRQRGMRNGKFPPYRIKTQQALPRKRLCVPFCSVTGSCHSFLCRILGTKLSAGTPQNSFIYCFALAFSAAESAAGPAEKPRGNKGNPCSGRRSSYA